MKRSICALLLNGPISVAALISPTSHVHHRTPTTLDNRKRSRKRRRRNHRGPKHYNNEGSDISGDEYDIFYSIDHDEPIDHAGLSKSIDDEYAMEAAKLDLTFWEVLEREKARSPSEFSSHMTPYERAKRRMDFVKGDIESKYQLMSERVYGSPELLDKDHLNNPPTLDDLNMKPATFASTYWSQPLFRVGVIATAYFSFPYLCKLLINFQTIDPKDFTTVVNQLAPNVGVLYATILALTLAVLYNRFTRIQENVTTEATLLSGLTRNVLCLFQDEPKWAIDACQMIANQIRIMISRTRGVELLSIMKADTYSNILALVDDYHFLHGCDDTFTAAQESTMGNIRGDIEKIMEVRALRLSDEASSLPPTHFFLLTSLSTVSSIAFITASLAVIDDLNDPPVEARLLFAGLMALYVLFFNFCKDLNGPFQGVYQIKRSNAVSQLLQTKWLIVSQLGDSINFGEFHVEDELKREEHEDSDLSLIDKMKCFFSSANTEPEEVAQVEVDTMTTLLNELDKHNNVQVSSTSTNERNMVVNAQGGLSSESSIIKGESRMEPILPEKQPTTTPSSECESNQHQPENGHIEASEVLSVSLECIDNSGFEKTSNIHIDKQAAKVSQQYDYAEYFRSTGGFSS